MYAGVPISTPVWVSGESSTESMPRGCEPLATAVATKAYEMNLARRKRPGNIRQSIAAMMYTP